MRQFVCQQAIPFRLTLSIAASAEYDVIRDCVRVRADCARGFSGIVIIVDAHTAEIKG